MPRRKKSVPDDRPQPSKARRTNTAVTVNPTVPTSTAINATVSHFPEIDYTKFVAEFVRQQGHPPMQITGNNGSETVTAVSGTRNSESSVPAASSKSANENVQDLVNNILSGEPSAAASLNSPSIQISDGILLGTSIPQKVKDKIWGDEFIEMNVLTPSYVEDPVSVFISQKKFSVINNNKNKTPLTIEQWTSAFLVFMDIYIEKRPEHARSLLKYMHTIREMYDLFGDEAWRVYDERFRRLRESLPLPWGKLVDELYTKSANSLVTTKQKNTFRSPSRYTNTTLISTATTTGKSNSGPNPNQNRYTYRVKTCLFYNRGEPCKQPCPFKHICHHCKGQHPRYQCGDYVFKINGQNNSTNTSYTTGKQGSGQNKPTTYANTGKR